MLAIEQRPTQGHEARAAAGAGGGPPAGAGRAPDPVLQQVEHFGGPTTSVNDAFRPVSRSFDRITKHEQLLSTLPKVARVLTDPAYCGPVVSSTAPR